MTKINNTLHFQVGQGRENITFDIYVDNDPYMEPESVVTPKPKVKQAYIVFQNDKHGRQGLQYDLSLDILSHHEKLNKAGYDGEHLKATF